MLGHIDIEGLYCELQDEAELSVDLEEFTERLQNHMNLFKVVVAQPAKLASLGRELSTVSALMRRFYRAGDAFSFQVTGWGWDEQFPWLKKIEYGRYDAEAKLLKCWGTNALTHPPKDLQEERPEAVVRMLNAIQRCLSRARPILPRDVTSLFPRSLKHRNLMAKVLVIHPGMQLETKLTGRGLDGAVWYEVVSTLCSDVSRWRIGTYENFVMISDGFHIVAGEQKEITC